MRWWITSYYKGSEVTRVDYKLHLHNIFVLEDDIEVEEYTIVVYSSISVEIYSGEDDVVIILSEM